MIFKFLRPSYGICYVVLPERGHLAPGMFCVGGDSHLPTGGAFAAYMFGIGATEMAGVLHIRRDWVKVPETILISLVMVIWSDYVTAKDMMLATRWQSAWAADVSGYSVCW